MSEPLAFSVVASNATGTHSSSRKAFRQLFTKLHDLTLADADSVQQDSARHLVARPHDGCCMLAKAVADVTIPSTDSAVNNSDGCASRRSSTEALGMTYAEFVEVEGKLLRCSRVLVLNFEDEAGTIQLFQCWLMGVCTPTLSGSLFSPRVVLPQLDAIALRQISTWMQWKQEAPKCPRSRDPMETGSSKMPPKPRSSWKLTIREPERNQRRQPRGRFPRTEEPT